MAPVANHGDDCISFIGHKNIIINNNDSFDADGLSIDVDEVMHYYKRPATINICADDKMPTISKLK